MSSYMVGVVMVVKVTMFVIETRSYCQFRLLLCLHSLFLFYPRGHFTFSQDHARYLNGFS